MGVRNEVAKMNSTSQQDEVTGAYLSSVRDECWDLRVSQNDHHQSPSRSLPSSRYWILLFIILAIAFICFASGAFGKTQRTLVTHDDLDRGGFAFRSVEGDLELAPVLASEADYQVNGILARARITQHFMNPYNEWQEGIYVFPLPETAAVDTLVMRIGDRVIEGQIKPRTQARIEYEEASAAGHQAALVDQERPNIFTASVANIAPGASISIEIEYQHKVDVYDGEYSLRLPLVVGPRYVPSKPLLALINNEPGVFLVPSAEDAERITPPVRDPSEGLINPVHLTVTLAPGFPLATTNSSSHKLDIISNQDGSYIITSAEGVVPADKDFELTWTPELDTAPQVSLFKEEVDGEIYLLGMVTSPSIKDRIDIPRVPREVIFVIDTSGSMSGTSMPQAKEALQLALRRLQPQDSFNIIRFSDDASALFDSAMPADRKHVLIALSYASSLDSGGGTEMMPALRLALHDQPSSGHLKQIIFITDGSVGNEAELFEVVASNIGKSRLFAVGIGSAPNGYFMRKASELGRGSFTIIDDINEVAERMSDLFATLERPMVTDLVFNWPDAKSIGVYPNPLPDLYAGQPLIFTARMREANDAISISGEVSGDSWSTSLQVASARSSEGIAKLWALDRIDDLNNSVFEGASADFIKKRVTGIALDFGLLTKHTSMVAIDVTPVRPIEEALATHELSTNLPDGWNYESVFDPAQKASAPMLDRARNSSAPITVQKIVSLNVPQGATTAQLFIISGLIVFFAGLVILFLRRRTRLVA
jgi:Ca-activated chloride channel homolog